MDKECNTNNFAEFNRLFSRVFGSAMEPSLYQYKYGKGSGVSVAIGLDGRELAAHCGLIFQDLYISGEKQRAVQFGDLMVSPEHRGGGVGQGSNFANVFRSAVNLASDYQMGAPIYGFPSERATRLGERLGLIYRLDQINEISWTPLTGRFLGRRIFSKNIFSSMVLNWCWSKMRRDLSQNVMVDRSPERFFKRYFQHPTNEYLVYHLSHRIYSSHSIVVFKVYDQTLELVDFVSALNELTYIVQQGRILATELKCSNLKTWQTHSMSTNYAKACAEIHPLPITFSMAAQFGTKLDAEHSSKIWIAPGDTDYH